MLRMLLTLACCWIAAVAAAPQNPPRTRPLPANLPETNPYSAPSDAEIGRRLFAGRCGHCHGQSGEGGRGAILTTGQFRHGASDRELFATIRNGVPTTEMPGTNLPDTEIWRLVAYVRQLGRQGVSDPITGDAAAGAEVYRRNGCATCHRIDGSGSFLGPDLTDAGARRATRYLRQSIVDPGADISLDYRTVSVVTRAKQTVTGIHLNEDEYSVHLRDVNGSLRSFMKSELSEMTLPRSSLMPSYAALPSGDLDDLVAYLVSLSSRSKDLRYDGDPSGRPEGLRYGNEMAESKMEVWTFDRLDSIGGHKTTVLGDPKVIDSPVGKAVEFDGVDDGLVIENHPLAGAEAFTWEAVFRPDGGQREQRWFHLSELDPSTGLDTDNRLLFEIRVAGDQWFLDSYAQSGSMSKTLMNRASLHPLGAWYHVAAVYDGKEFSNYVNGAREGGGEVRLAPYGPGHASVGVRINRVFYFKGAVRMARFSRRALSPSEFLQRSQP